MFERRIGLDAAIDLLFEAIDMLPHRLDQPVQFGLQRGDFGFAARVHQRGPFGDRRVPGANQFLQFLDGLRRGLGRSRIELLGHQRQHARVDPVGLRQGPVGLGEQPRAQGIDDSDRKTGGGQRAMRQAMVFSGRLHDDLGDAVFATEPLEYRDAAGVVGETATFAKRLDMDVEPIFTNVDAGIELCLRDLVGHSLALHTGLAPNHLFRPSARANGPSSSTVQAEGPTVPLAQFAGGGHPRRIAANSSPELTTGPTCKGRRGLAETSREPSPDPAAPGQPLPRVARVGGETPDNSISTN